MNKKKYEFEVEALQCGQARPYADSIYDYIVICIEPYILKSNACNPDDCGLCNMLQYIWLLQDYKEPEEPEVDWSKVAVDTPILVRQGEDGEWIRRHFAKYEGGIVYTWKDSRTSWTEDSMTGWKQAKLAETQN